MRKDGELTIEFTFLIFLAVIVVLVVVTLIIQFALNGNNLFCKITRTCDETAAPGVPDNQVIDLTGYDCQRVQDSLIKHAKLCYERVGDSAQTDQVICYTILSPGGCTFTPADIENALLADNVVCIMDASPADSKLVVTFVREGKHIAII